MGVVSFSAKTAIISLNNINQLIFVMVKCGVFLEVWTEFLNFIQMSFSFKRLKSFHGILIDNKEGIKSKKPGH
jgi:hypothetical protein